MPRQSFAVITMLSKEAFEIVMQQFSLYRFEAQIPEGVHSALMKRLFITVSCVSVYTLST